MQKILIFALAGFVAQLVDGSLGMGFGASSSSILLTFGITPAIVSATVHFSQIATTFVSGTSHLKFDNVHKPTMWRLALPGAVAAFIGAALLSNIHGEVIRPYISLFLLSMGIYILYQFLFKRNHPEHSSGLQRLKRRFTIPQGFIAGLLDAMGGGGWGPVNTPILLSSKKLEPRYVIGTVSASEFFVTLSASISFIIFLGFGNINWGTVIALALGGVLAAPIAAYLVKILPVNILAICVSGLIIFTNSNALLGYFHLNSNVVILCRFAIIIIFIILIIWMIQKNKKMAFSKQSHSHLN
ncbi:sulfite exporter TauE/SafE family protein [Staphylococcus chromogenes]|uniref:sulfite exporter TauE/SafE family protein n=1 Tax=Staphylococcus chromogenes TaxID=46126 RepID=UPI000D047A1D|nr:sulfite exporter TauE/SafE family protein [Staphylococcus chromogenes]PTF57987.1 sulfite exporter TauE/SafE family protein [Staphylococcus chromogenes]PTF77988.1 sulfite exporter TauE/SafE family protein [Staphylococcus chromogenes]PTF93582.1 sulfite exporter TauE/SafE family protein [Staphylococcus chromogenes]PTF99658.1 sulfite exporter TauE/SafE family protein [Staphylococcus chromogenes]PTG44497.1 sulfite exporter TauE/SafE family protein [Staphylococcus chromogenes]